MKSSPPTSRELGSRGERQKIKIVRAMLRRHRPEGGLSKLEYESKMNFHLSAVDDMLRHRDDRRSIGPHSLQVENEMVAEYALRGIANPLGISGFTNLEKLLEQLKGSMPTMEEIEAELAKQPEPSARPSGPGFNIVVFGGITEFINTGRHGDHHPRSPGRQTVVQERQHWGVGISNLQPIFSRSDRSRHSSGLAAA
jgi:hypothetical protein